MPRGAGAAQPRPKILITAPGFDAEHPDTGGRLRAAGFELDHVGPKGGRTSAEVAMLAADAVAVIASSDPFTAEAFDNALGMKVIARLGVGVDSIDLEAAT